MRFAIQLHYSGFSIAKTVAVLENFVIDRARSTIPNWVHKTGLEPASGQTLDRVALDESAVKCSGEHFWLYSAVDGDTSDILHVRPFPTLTTVVTKLVLRALVEKHDSSNVESYVDGALCLQAGLFRLGMHFQHETFGNRNPLEHIF